MNPARFAARHARAVLLVTALVAVAGAIAGLGLPSSIYPELRFPRIIILAHAGTMPARSMTLTVARPLEEALMEVPGVRRVRSRTFRGATEISAQFAPRTDMVVALQEAQSRIAEARGALPAETELTIDRLTPAAFPIYGLNLAGGLSSADLYDYGYYVVRPALARVEGVGRVDVLASDRREIEVIVDPSRLIAASLTIEDVAEALRSTNQLSPVGRYTESGLQHLVLASGLWDSVAAIGRTPVVSRAGATLRLTDIAEVLPGAPDRTTLVVGHTGDAAAISVSEQIGANILDVRAGLESELERIAAALPAGLTLSKTYDLAEFVAAAIANVRDAILIGGLLAVLVLLLFLRNWRLTLVAAATLPLTVLATFLCLRIFGGSINLMSMGGLAVAIGLVIDDAVVVVENIHRRLAAAGDDRAIEPATAELVAPVVGSTLTTVVVFAPLGLLSGVVGQFFRALSLTLSAAVLVSLVLAFTLIPLLARAAYRRGAHGQEVSGRIDRAYTRALPALLRRPALAASIALLLGAAAVASYFGLGTGFLPAADEGGFVIDYLTPPGTALEGTDARLRKVEAILQQTPEVASFVRRTGSEMGFFATQMNSGDILVRLAPRSERSRSAAEIIEGLRDKLESAAPDMEIEFVQLLQDMLGDLEGTPTPIEVKIFGDDPLVLQGLAGELQARVEQVTGVVDVVGMQQCGPEATWQIDAAAAGRLGLTVEQVAGQLADAWLGRVATDLRLLDRAIPVRVRYPDAVRFDPARLASTTIRSASGKLVPAGSIAQIGRQEGEPELWRENLRQMAIVTARLEGRDLGGAVAEIRRMMESTRLPVGYTWEVGGQYASQRRAFRELLLVLGIATALVFVVLVVEFRMFSLAALILAAAPLSLGGAFALLAASGTELNVSSAMGLILLVGLVVKNGIVLLDFAERRRAEGLEPQEAVLLAARTRLRPILMTTLCTLFGLLPLALGLGSGAELQMPLALTVIGGLTLSTFVTLFLVPVGYLAVVSRRRRAVHASRPLQSPSG